MRNNVPQLVKQFGLTNWDSLTQDEKGKVYGDMLYVDAKSRRLERVAKELFGSLLDYGSTNCGKVQLDRFDSQWRPACLGKYGNKVYPCYVCDFIIECKNQSSVQTARLGK